MSKTPEIVFRGRPIRVDDNGLVCISDIWSAAGFSVNQKPSQWRRLPQVGQLLTALVERMMGKSHHNAVYQALFDKAANDLRRDMGIKKSVALRDAMSTDELVYIMASEQLASERIKDEVCHGNSECSEASCRSAGFIRTAIEADRADRQKRRLV